MYSSFSHTLQDNPLRYVFTDCLSSALLAGSAAVPINNRGSFQAAKDHSAGAGLQGTGDHHRNGFSDFLSGGFDDHHGPVFQITDPLSFLLAQFDDLDPEIFSRQENGLEGVG